MASKTYIVMKNGEEIEKLKTLTAAKKLADAEGAEVICGEKCVYYGKDVSAEGTGETGETGKTDGTDKADAEDTAEASAPETQASAIPAEAAEESDAGEQAEAEQAGSEAEQVIIKTEPVVAKKPAQPETKPVETMHYRLTMLMNIRKKPSLTAQIVNIKPAGTLVRAVGIEGDWLHLSDGSYVLYKNGEYARKVEE